uniref:ornithine decarboxylase n=1 Tax=Acrobeloides nanus TaxID=290746 RepID=A0A914E887_9BILA
MLSNGNEIIKIGLKKTNSAYYTVEDFYGTRVIVYDRHVDAKYVARRLADYKAKLEDDDLFGVVNLKVLVNRYNEFKICLPRVEPYYAVKCNNDLAILRTLAKLGCGFDCASKAEIDLYLQRR